MALAMRPEHTGRERFIHYFALIISIHGSNLFRKLMYKGIASFRKVLSNSNWYLSSYDANSASLRIPVPTRALLRSEPLLLCGYEEPPSCSLTSWIIPRRPRR